MLSLFISPLVAIVKAYVAQVATKEIAHAILLAVAQAIVKSTKTPEDDKWFEVIKQSINK